MLPGYQKRPLARLLFPVRGRGGKQINTDQNCFSLINEWESLTLVCAAAASLTVISVKAVSGMITESIKGQLQFIYPIFYVMLVVMFASCGFQIKSVRVCSVYPPFHCSKHPDGYICTHVWLLQHSLFPFFPPHRFLNEAMKVFDATEVVPINFVFFTASAIIAGALTVSFW